METAIWLHEVAPKIGKQGRRVLDRLKIVNERANPDLFRIAFKLATGAGKTTVMAMLIIWQTINAVRYPQTKSFSRAFLIATPGITIKDRLRVLQPHDPESYYKTRDLVPHDMIREMDKVKIVITNYHAFKLREKMPLNDTSKNLLRGRKKTIHTKETEAQMIKRVMSDLMGMKNIVVLNDEAHHCYKPPCKDDNFKDTDEEAKNNNATAGVWFTGIKAVKRVLGVRMVYDLSATPFFIQGSGYDEGTLFPWVSSDFSLMDAIESGIVKLPRIPLSDNITKDNVPMYRYLWSYIGKSMPKAGQRSKKIDPDQLPVELKTALEALYGHYEKVFKLWKKVGITVPPVFIVVCNNTATSKLVYQYISGFVRGDGEDHEYVVPGHLPLFQNYNNDGSLLSKPRTLLIDSVQLESGDAIDKKFREVAASEIDQFRREILERTGNQKESENIDDATLLREVMNTVGKKGALGEQIRCVVSVSMLTEGWDAQTVTHILGVRAFGTQLLCEQVVGRALRRQSYTLNADGLFDVEYADILGIPFDFTKEPVEGEPRTPAEDVQVKAIRERDSLKICFPKVKGYRTELPSTLLIPEFTRDHTFILSPDVIGPSIVEMGNFVGVGNELTLVHTKDVRKNTVIYTLAAHLLYNHYRDANQLPKHHLFMPLVKICRYWVEHHLECIDGTYLAQVLYEQVKEMVAMRIKAAISEDHDGKNIVKAVLAPYDDRGSSVDVDFVTSTMNRYETRADKSHVNWVIYDSDWELKMVKALENSPRVLAYVKNHRLRFEVPYLFQGIQRLYRPDFIAKINDGLPDSSLNLVIEVKGKRDEAAVEKANTMKAFWVPGINHLKKFGRWDFVEFHGEIFKSEPALQNALDSLLETYAQKNASV